VLELSADVKEAFSSFTLDTCLFALPLPLSNMTLRPLPPISYPNDTQNAFQQALNRLDTVLSPKHVLFLVLRRNNALVAVTYVPYLASAESKKTILEGRKTVVENLGQHNFAASIICKEMGEITDARSWDERDGQGQGQSWTDTDAKQEQPSENTEDDHAEHPDIKDKGYKKTKCRLCDRRMKNKMNDDALSALSSLGEDGACVQLVGHPPLLQNPTNRLLHSLSTSPPKPSS
jgi:twinfilin-like protein